MKVNLDEEIINPINAYSPQPVCGDNDKVTLWE